MDGHGPLTPRDRVDPCGPTCGVVGQTGPSVSGVTTGNLEAHCEHRGFLVGTRPMATALHTPGAGATRCTQVQVH